MRTIQLIVITAVVASGSTLALNHFLRPSVATPTMEMQPSAGDARMRVSATSMRTDGSRVAANLGRREASAAGQSAEGQLNPDQMEAQTSKLMREYERQFRTEPVAPAWANSTELAVVDALRSDEAKATGVATPSEFDVQCRSSLCRIDATYPDDGSAGDAMTVLAMDVSDKLPRMHRRTIYKPDGTVQLHVYAAR